MNRHIAVRVLVLGVVSLTLIAACGNGEAEPVGVSASANEVTTPASTDRLDGDVEGGGAAGSALLPDPPLLSFEFGGDVEVTASPSWVSWPGNVEGRVESLSEFPNMPEPRGSLTVPVGSVVTARLPLPGTLEFAYRTSRAHQLEVTPGSGDINDDRSIDVRVPDDLGSYILEVTAAIEIDHPKGPFVGRLRYATRVTVLPDTPDCPSANMGSSSPDVYGWTTVDGCPVDIDTVQTFRPGPEFHCSGWPPSVRILTPDGGHARYTRDPGAALGDTGLQEGFDSDATLPDDVVDSGYRQGNIAIYLSPGDESVIYLDFGNTVEQWPLDPETVACA